MPKGYQLNTYYDALRAVNRKMYSKQIKMLSSEIKRRGIADGNAYNLIFFKIKQGLCDNLDLDVFNKTHYVQDPTKYIGNNKSSLGQDFMSPMELRMQAIAVRRTYQVLHKLPYNARVSVDMAQNIAYDAGVSTAQDFKYITNGKEEFDLHIEQPVLNVQPIIKKYDAGLKSGTLPYSKTFVPTSPQQKQEKDRLLYLNVSLFSQIKEKLMQIGLLSKNQRQNVFASFNSSYYETDMAETHTLEISKIIISNHLQDYISLTELQMNCDKLGHFLKELNNIKIGTPDAIVQSEMAKAGRCARTKIIQKYKSLPELYSGFYYTYIDSDKRFLASISKPNQTK